MHAYKPLESNQLRLAPHPSYLAPRGFTLVELLVVITIIGILAALLVAAAVGALNTAKRTRIKAEATEIANGFEEYKNKVTAYPPNAQTDYGAHGSLTTVQKNQIFNDLKKHLAQIAPRNKEPDELLLRLAGLFGGSPGDQLVGGMTAGEALVFWLSGFSTNPEYPISGDGGPSFLVGDIDAVESRSWIYPVEVTRLGPRDASGNFNGRSITYSVNIKGVNQTRGINMWQYFPANSQEPYIYMDTSRYTPDVFDPPASSAVHIHALKKIDNNRPLFATPDKFQVMHCGIDDVWGDDVDRTSFECFQDEPDLFLTYPEGPFTGELGDTIVNFSTETTLEDSQP